MVQKWDHKVKYYGPEILDEEFFKKELKKMGDKGWRVSGVICNLMNQVVIIFVKEK